MTAIGQDRAPEPDFDPVAHVYRWAEYLALGPLLQRTRLTHLRRLGDCRNALLLGDGDGRFLARLLARNTRLHAVAVDTSPKMLRLLEARCCRVSPTAATRLRTVHASALRFTVSPATDLIVTHFFLDCLPQREVDRLVRNIAGAVSPGTRWLLSDFALLTHPLLRPFGRLYIRALYFVFQLLTGLRVQMLPDPQAALASHGFRLLARRSRLLGLLYSELWVFDPEGPGTTPLSSPVIHPGMASPPENTEPARHQPPPADALPDPEPAVPSLPEPDPAVFHRQPGTPPSE